MVGTGVVRTDCDNAAVAAHAGDEGAAVHVAVRIAASHSHTQHAPPRLPRATPSSRRLLARSGVLAYDDHPISRR